MYFRSLQYVHDSLVSFLLEEGDYRFSLMNYEAGIDKLHISTWSLGLVKKWFR